jgi:ABC-type polysaccharide/polyol phosphate transport system ATPase subunit
VSVIEVSNVWKQYRRPHQRVNTLKEAVIAFVRGQTGYEEFWALSRVSFTVEPGEAIGVIGPNGSGKSTLLGLLARVLKPTSGSVAVNGRICPLLGLGTGFHPELTGRENVFLNASLLGLGRREVARQYEAIVDFAELSDVMETPMKTYSTGMMVRLGFSVAVHLDPDVLLIDEVLSVGDEHFQHKSFDRLLQFKEAGRTIFVVSHDLSALAELCGRAIWLDGGNMVADTGCQEVIDAYRKAVAEGERRAREAKARDARAS